MLHPLLLSVLSLLLTYASATCYFPDGDISPADVSCDAKSSDSFCCYSKQACLSNKICLTGVTSDGINQYARGTCTDQTWQSGACPNFCLDSQALGNVMYSCNITGVDEYCCNENCNCDGAVGNEVVSFTGTPYTISVIGVISTYSNPSATLSSSSGSVTSSSDDSYYSTTLSEYYSSSSSVSSSARQSSTSEQNGSAAPAATSSASTTPIASTQGKSNSVAVGAGVGVGVGVFIVLLAAGVFFLYRRRRARAGKSGGRHSGKETTDLPQQSGEQKVSEKGFSDAQYADQHGNQNHASELSPTGHEYNELGVDSHHQHPANLPSYRPDVSELPGQ